jgi:CHAT domain-containing protein
MTPAGGSDFVFNGPVHHNGPTAYGTNSSAVQPSAPEAGPQIRILWLAANPLSTARLALDEEAREVTEKLRLARDREVFEFITRWAVRPADLLQHLNEHRPRVVHFSGHGDSAGMIALSAGEGNSRPVTTAALAEMFRIVRDEVRLVVLNACYSAVQAQAIGQHIDHVVGMLQPIDDRSAVIFAAAFYSALGFGRPVHEAFEQGKVALMLHGMPDHDVPNLLTRPGADPFVVVT